MKTKITIVFLLLGMTQFLAESMQAQQTITGNLLHKGLNRTYRLRLPAGHSASEKIPLVFNMHGFTSNASQQELYSGMNAVADTARFAVCYPNGIATSWNVGWTFGSTADDVGFISALTDELISKYNFDINRVYACGMSNGGFMSFRLACELSNKIAAIASVTGSIVPGRLQLCNPGRPVPVLAIHGTADDVVPYNGGAISLPIEQVVDFWKSNNVCQSQPSIFEFPNINTSDNSTAVRFSYAECNDNSAVDFIKIIGGGHTWPGSAINNGVVNRDLNASVEIWRFFKRFSMSELSSSTVFQSSPGTIKIYPNPSSDFLRIEGINSEEKITITDVRGHIIEQSDFKQTTTQIIFSVEHFTPGLYFIHLRSGDSIKIFKFVKI